MKEILNTKQKIILSSKSLFKIYGYKNTTMKKIAEKAEINLSLLNYYFPQKQNIVNEIINNFINDIYEKSLIISKGNHLISFYATRFIYYNKMINDSSNKEFYISILNRHDIVNNMNFNKIYLNVADFLNLNVSYHDLFYKNICIFGANKELINAYNNNVIDVTFSILVETLIENSFKILDISDYVLEDSKIKSKFTIKKLKELSFSLFE